MANCLVMPIGGCIAKRYATIIAFPSNSFTGLCFYRGRNVNFSCEITGYVAAILIGDAGLCGIFRPELCRLI